MESLLLFNAVYIDMKPLTVVVLWFRFDCHQYVNDTQLYFVYQFSTGVVNVLEQHLETLANDDNDDDDG